MTGQIPDAVIYHDRLYALTGQEGDGLFDPSALGLRPLAMSTACWRGYVCEYTVVDGGLVLTELEMLVEGEPPTLFGVTPAEDASRGRRYEGLREPVRFTGRLLLGREFLNELYVHMGFQSPWKYEDVQELVFENGHLTEAHDRSEAAAQRRRAEADARRRGAEQSAAHPVVRPPDPAEPDATRSWIEKSFSLDIDL
ncbi:hypothetical protein AB0L06_29665 [Spirillospora sp. NPDC052269]